MNAKINKELFILAVMLLSAVIIAVSFGIALATGYLIGGAVSRFITKYQ